MHVLHMTHTHIYVILWNVYACHHVHDIYDMYVYVCYRYITLETAGVCLLYMIYMCVYIGIYMLYMRIHV